MTAHASRSDQDLSHIVEGHLEAFKLMMGKPIRLQKSVDCLFCLAQELYRIACLLTLERLTKHCAN